MILTLFLQGTSPPVIPPAYGIFSQLISQFVTHFLISYI